MRFFTGLHQPSDAQHINDPLVSVNRLRGRKAPLQVRDWIMDSGAFTEISTHGHYRHGVAEYAAEIRRWATNGSGTLLAAVSQSRRHEPHDQRRDRAAVSHQLELLSDAPVVDEYTRLIAAGGRSHFRDQMRRYGAQWPYLVPYWRACIEHFERMEALGYDAAGPLPKPPSDEQRIAA